MSPEALIMWAIQEIRELDEQARALIPGYDPLHSEDMEKLARLKLLASEHAAKQWRRK